MPQPIFQFKAGKCEVNDAAKPYKVKPVGIPGFIYLYVEEDLTHFCWRPRTQPIDDEDNEEILDLMLFPGDARFEPWNVNGQNSGQTNGRVYRLSFDSSSTVHFFWLQAKNQHPEDKPEHWSERDLKLGHMVNEILKGEEVDVSQFQSVSRGPGGEGDDDEDAEMHDADENGPASGGAGAGATGGDATEEGKQSRQGGADGARAGNTRSVAPAGAPQDAASAAVANLLQSLQGNTALAGQFPSGQQPAQGKLFTTLPELLQPSNTLPIVQTADDAQLNVFLSLLPPQLLLLAQEADDVGSADPTPATAQAAIQALTPSQKRDIITKVLRSPQFSQSLTSLTAALRDGGLPTIGDALKIQIENGGFVHHGAVPLGGGEAVEAFLEGIKVTLEQEQKRGKSGSDEMQTD